MLHLSYAMYLSCVPLCSWNCVLQKIGKCGFAILCGGVWECPKIADRLALQDVQILHSKLKRFLSLV